MDDRFRYLRVQAHANPRWALRCEHLVSRAADLRRELIYVLQDARAFNAELLAEPPDQRRESRELLRDVVNVLEGACDASHSIEALDQATSALQAGRATRRDVDLALAEAQQRLAPHQRRRS